MFEVKAYPALAQRGTFEAEHMHAIANVLVLCLCLLRTSSTPGVDDRGNKLLHVQLRPQWL